MERSDTVKLEKDSSSSETIELSDITFPSTPPDPAYAGDDDMNEKDVYIQECSLVDDNPHGDCEFTVGIDEAGRGPVLGTFFP